MNTITTQPATIRPTLNREHATPTKRLALLWSGHVLMLLGVIGMLLPVMPTTVFWIGAAICYSKSSPALYKKLVGHERYGKEIQRYLDDGVISRRSKAVALLGMSGSGVFIVLTPLGEVATAVALLLLAAAALYVASLPSTANSTKE